MCYYHCYFCFNCLYVVIINQRMEYGFLPFSSLSFISTPFYLQLCTIPKIIMALVAQFPDNRKDNLLHNFFILFVWFFFWQL